MKAGQEKMEAYQENIATVWRTAKRRWGPR
jgi:hypothetical protein